MNIVITKMIINGKSFKVFIQFDDKKEIVNLEIFRDDKSSILNNVYAARVENIVENINSAFVNISHDQKCYLSLKDSANYIYSRKNSNKDKLCAGDEILVQVIKDAVKTKDPVVSSKITLHGKYSVLTTENTTISVSKKIDGNKSTLLKDAISQKFSDHKDQGYGFIVRTNSMNITEDELFSDMEDLVRTYTDILSKAPHYSLYSLVYEDYSDYLLKLNSVNMENVGSIITDDMDIYEQIKGFYDQSDLIKSKISLYEDSLPLSTLYSLTSKIDKLTDKKVWLDSGANIIIEQLETLTVVDVNTAKNNSKKADMLSVNKEAAREIIRQLRLRNISGMIIIDFINMKSEDQQNELISYIKELLKADDRTCTYMDITKLGLIELTRKKTSRSLLEQLNF